MSNKNSIAFISAIYHKAVTDTGLIQNKSIQIIKVLRYFYRTEIFRISKANKDISVV